MFGLVVYALALIVGIIGATWICGLVGYLKQDWRHRVTAEDLAELSRLFESEGSFVGFNDKNEKFLVGYPKD